uniref:Uncharacterized protein n=1 Tax=Knipowitschia caucasica TaxID=637954 RepID=A0AAV2K3G3_KNICA
MSRRRSAGDLVPKDITAVLAREARGQRGHRKTGGSLGLAFNWFKGGKRKKSIGNGHTPAAVGVKDNKGHINEKAGPKGKDEQKKLTVHYTACRQENVFIEGSRPQHLEDLHTEALEGLKIQQEENRNGVENTHAVSFPDDESVTSTITLQQEQNISSKDEDGCSESRSPTGNTDTSDFSAGSTRPGLICQGSTFKPLHPVKSIDRNKKRSRRTTIMGIPHQVQKELALRRHSTFQQLPENNNTSSNQSGVVVIPTVDGGTPVSNGEGARVHLSELEQVSREESILVEQLQAMYQNKLHFSFQGFGHHTGPTTMRPKSVAVPGMTASLSSPASMLSFLQEPQGPVMSISPQATYLSTIIPNAILPISVDVIEIDHSLHRTRGSSVHAVSKSSLESGESPASPLLYRRSDKPSSHFDTYQNNSSTPPASESQSSKTIVLVSSPTSSKRSTGSADSHRLSSKRHSNDVPKGVLPNFPGKTEEVTSQTRKIYIPGIDFCSLSILSILLPHLIVI